MLKKNYSKTRKFCRITFKFASESEAKTAAVVGEFNDWDTSKHTMKRLKNGSFSATVSVEAGREYRFRYFVDGKKWENEKDADKYIPNEFGTEDSVVEV